MSHRAIVIYVDQWSAHRVEKQRHNPDKNTGQLKYICLITRENRRENSTENVRKSEFRHDCFAQHEKNCHNSDQGARRPHISCSICVHSVGAFAKAVRLFIASHRNQQPANAS